jgi:uncharacterized membrane protein YfcA
VDSSGKATHLWCIKSLARGGTYVSPGATSGGDATTDLSRIFWMQLRILGSTMGNNTEFAQVAALYRAGALKPVVGGIILGLTVLQVARLWRPAWFGHFPHATWFAWLLGGFAGVTTMLANAAGPVVALYLLAVALPKNVLIATAAWLFLVLNILKLPFSWQLGLITPDTLRLNLLLAPMVLVGLLAGKWIVKRIPQRLFDTFILLFTATAGLRLMGLW